MASIVIDGETSLLPTGQVLLMRPAEMVVVFPDFDGEVISVHTPAFVEIKHLIAARECDLRMREGSGEVVFITASVNKNFTINGILPRCKDSP